MFFFDQIYSKNLWETIYKLFKNLVTLIIVKFIKARSIRKKRIQ